VPKVLTFVKVIAAMFIVAASRPKHSSGLVAI
jgi:hypothetical protein